MAQILVVDDEAPVRQVAARILAEAGHQIQEAADGEEAYDLVCRAPGACDLVLTDVIMPRLNGIELLQRISVLCPGLPVVLMSGFGAAELAERGIAEPCGLVAKPFPPQLLIDAVRRCLDLPRAGAAS